MQGLLFAALAKLAAQGFVAQPADSPDLIHDFFLYSWDGIERHFDPKQASLSTYVFAAFARFARPRIVRLQRQRAMLLPPEELTKLSDAWHEAPSPDERLDLRRLERVLSGLPVGERELLRRWLDATRQSERASARELGLSRYELRLRLIETLGRVAIALGAIEHMRGVDRQVALLVWRDGFTIPEAASKLSVTQQQVRNAYLRNQQLMQLTLGRMQPGLISPARSSNMTSQQDQAARDLLRKIPGSPDDPVVLAEVQQHALALVHLLNEMASDLPREWEALSPNRLGAFYGAISRGLGLGPADEYVEPVDEVFFEGATNDRMDVGHAFAEVLVPALRRGITPLLQDCRQRTPALRRSEREKLFEQPDVRSGGEHALALAEFGLTPSHLVLASDAVGMHIDRAIEAGYFPAGDRLIFRRNQYAVKDLWCEGADVNLTRQDLTDEIKIVASVEEELAGVLLDWAVDSSPHVRTMFIGFRSELVGNDVRLVQAPPSLEAENLYLRWKPSELAVDLRLSYRGVLGQSMVGR
jgi:DNA-directed RNA polymerase specialized sigma24 family protein